jgi:hypothetical protein
MKKFVEKLIGLVSSPPVDDVLVVPAVPAFEPDAGNVRLPDVCGPKNALIVSGL